MKSFSSAQHHKKSAMVSIGLASMLTFALNNVVFGQAVGVEVVVDTAFYGPNTPTPEDSFDPAGELDGYVSYLVYAVMTNPTDVLSAIFSDGDVLTDGGPLVINSGVLLQSCQWIRCGTRKQCLGHWTHCLNTTPFGPSAC